MDVTCLLLSIINPYWFKPQPLPLIEFALSNNYTVEGISPNFGQNEAAR